MFGQSGRIAWLEHFSCLVLSCRVVIIFVQLNRWCYIKCEKDDKGDKMRDNVRDLTYEVFV